MTRWAMCALWMLCVLWGTACSPGETGSGGSGGAAASGETVAGGGVGGAPATTSTSTGHQSGAGGSTGQGGSGESWSCPAAIPDGCAVPDPLLAYDPTGDIGLPLGPILPWEKLGASIACFGPFTAEDTFSAVKIGQYTVDEEFAFDVWTQPTPDATGHEFVWTEHPALDTEPGPGMLTHGVYPIVPVSGPGYVCLAVPLSSLQPYTITSGTCEVPTRAQWLGLPWNDLNGDGEADSASELTVAPLACPKDTTSADGTPPVGEFHVGFPYGLVP